MKLNRNKIVFLSVALAVVLFLAGVSIFSVAERANGNTLPMPFGVGVAVIQTGSMEPNIPTGSLVVIIPDSSYEVDEVVAFQTEKGKIHTVHRIVAIDGDIITTCGDANDGSNDPAFNVSLIKGKVVLTIPWWGYFTNAMKHPVVIIFVAALAALLLVLSMRSDNTKEKDEQDVERIKAEIERLKAQQEGNGSAAETPTESPSEDAPDESQNTDENQ